MLGLEEATAEVSFFTTVVAAAATGEVAILLMEIPFIEPQQEAWTTCLSHC
jgi:hypothetical protein